MQEKWKGTEERLQELTQEYAALQQTRAQLQEALSAAREVSYTPCRPRATYLTQHSKL